MQLEDAGASVRGAWRLTLGRHIIIVLVMENCADKAIPVTSLISVIKEILPYN